MYSSLNVIKKRKALRQGRCQDCGSRECVTDKDSGEIVCSQCGLVLQEEMLNRKPEWRAFTLAEKRAKARVGSPTSLKQYDKGLSTTFQPYHDTYGRSLPIKERVKMQRLRRRNYRARMNSSSERNLSQAMTELTLLTDKLRLPKNVVETAARIYRKVLSKGLIRGRSIKSIMAATVYAACRLTQTPRGLKAVVDASPRKRSEITRSYRLIQRELDLKIPIDNPILYIPKIASKTELSFKTQKLAIELLHKAKKRNAVVGKGPRGLAAAALYLAAKLNGDTITQKALAQASGITEVTVRNRYQGLDKSLGLGLKKEISRL